MKIAGTIQAVRLVRQEIAARVGITNALSSLVPPQLGTELAEDAPMPAPGTDALLRVRDVWVPPSPDPDPGPEP